MKVDFALYSLFTLNYLTITLRWQILNADMNKALENAERALLYIAVFLVPLFVLSSFPDSFGLPKLIVVVSAVSLILVVRAIRLLANKKMDVAVSSFDIPLLLIVTAYILSTIFTANNKMEAFFAPGRVSLAVASLFLYFFLNNLNLSQKNNIKVLLFASTLVVALLSILATSGVFGSPAFLKPFLTGKNLYLTGGALPQILFVAAIIPMIVGLIVNSKDFAKKVFLGTGLVIISLNLVLSVVAILPGKPDALVLPTFKTSFAVTLDTLKESPIVGAGAGNYLSAFSRFKPVEYNTTDLWQVRFSTANNFYLTLITETGLVGLVGIVFLLVNIIGLTKKFRFGWDQTLKEGHALSLLVLAALLAFFPASTVTIILLFVLISLSATTRKIAITIPAHLSAVPYILSVPVLGLVAALYFFSYKALSAEYIYKVALESISKNDAKLTYDLMRQAISANPYVDRYHATYAQVNMSIAQAISQNKDISDADRQTITTLIQQAIREGKNTVFLNPTRSSNWELLARIYQAIMPFAQGADQFTIQSFGQAIALDTLKTA